MFRITLAAARVNAGLKQDEVCEMMHISKPTLIRWEKGVKTPKPAEFMMLCKIYNINEDNIFLP